MDAKLKAKCVKALRSGYYRQYRMAVYGGNDHAYCCIGVCGVVAGLQVTRWTTTQEVVDRLGLPDALARELVDMNDVQKLPFGRIADFIEANL